MKKIKGFVNSDKAGIVSAVLCTVHCLTIPALFFIKFLVAKSSNPLSLPQWWENLDYVFLIISLTAVYHSASHSRSKEIKRLLWIFWAILATAVIGGAAVHWMAYVASAGLIATHFFNLRRSRKAIAVNRSIA